MYGSKQITSSNSHEQTGYPLAERHPLLILAQQLRQLGDVSCDPSHRWQALIVRITKYSDDGRHKREPQAGLCARGLVCRSNLGFEIGWATRGLGGWWVGRPAWA